MTAATPSELSNVSRRVLQLQILTIIWMTVEAVVSLGTAWRSHSPALFAFGGDSLIELLRQGLSFAVFDLNSTKHGRLGLRESCFSRWRDSWCSLPFLTFLDIAKRSEV